MPFKAVLFDFGGTLDSDGIAWPQRFYPLYEEAGLKVSWEAFQKAFYRSDDALDNRLAGKGFEATLALQVNGVLETLAPDRSDLAPRIVRRFLDDSRAHFRRNKPFLERLRRSYKLGVVSNFYGNLVSVLESEGLHRHFDVLADSSALKSHKPDPAIFRHALDRLGVAAGDALMVGDSLPRDMKGAEDLGIPHAYLRPAATGGACCAGGGSIERLTDIGELLAAGTPR